MSFCRIYLADVERDIESILRFYRDNAHPGNRVRDPVQLIRTLKQGSFYVAEEDGRPIAVSACFHYFGKHTESGGARVVKNGFRLQQILNWCRIANEVAMRAPTHNFFSITAEDNAVSIYNLKKCGYEDWKPDAQTILEITAGDTAKSIRKLFFKYDFMDASLTKNTFSSLVETFDRGFVDHRENSDRLHLSFDFPLMRNEELREGYVRRVANGEISAVIAP